METMKTKQGVRNLNSPEGWPTSDLPLPDPVPVAEDDEKTNFHDLLYGDDAEMRKAIMETYPEARIENAHDWIKGPRIEAHFERISFYEWLCFLIRSELASVSLVFQVTMRMKEHRALIERCMDAECPGWRTRRKKG